MKITSNDCFQQSPTGPTSWTSSVSFLLLCMAKERYFTRMSAEINRNGLEYGESRWITSEDVNVEHLLDIFTEVNANSDSVRDASVDFMTHLVWHKRRPTVLRLKVEGLPDGRHSKPRDSLDISRFLPSVRNHVKRKRLLNTLDHCGAWGNDRGVALLLWQLSEANRLLGLPEEGGRLAEEAREISEQLGDAVSPTRSLHSLVVQLYSDEKLGAAEEAPPCTTGLLPEEGDRYLVCKSHRLLSHIYYPRGETEWAIYHLGVSLRIASSFNWHDQLFLTHYEFAQLFLVEGRFDEGQAHIECAKSYAVSYTYNMGRAMALQAWSWYKQHRLEEARSEALDACDASEKLWFARGCRELLRRIEGEMN